MYVYGAASAYRYYAGLADKIGGKTIPAGKKSECNTSDCLHKVTTLCIGSMFTRQQTCSHSLMET